MTDEWFALTLFGAFWAFGVGTGYCLRVLVEKRNGGKQC